MKIILAALLFSASLGTTFAQSTNFTETTAQHDARMAWWRDARFGMFIHWGLYAIPGRGEWVQWNEQIPVNDYAKLADQFNPTNYHPDAWAEIAKAAGMKYIVLTTRHHDGFCLFDDKDNPFTSVNTAAHRDLIAEYATAVRKAGLHVGFYYSPLDWRFPGFFFPDLQRQNAEEMRAQYHRQMQELMTHYGRLDVIWFDAGEQDWLSFGGDWKPGAKWESRPPGEHYKGGFNWESDQVYAQLRQLQPQAIINGRANMPPDFTSREGDGALGDFDDQHPWELCTTLNGTWGWKPDQHLKSLAECVQLLAKVAGRDGNLLLNIGMRPDGQIDPPQVERLREVGAWLDKYGESIYGTRGGPFLPGEYGASTHHDKNIYLHVLKWPGDKLILPTLPVKVLRATALTGGEVSLTRTDNQLELSLPSTDRSQIDTVIKLELDQPVDGFKPLPVNELKP